MAKVPLLDATHGIDPDVSPDGWSPDLSSSPLTFAAFPSPSFLHLDPTAPTLLVCSKPSLSDADNAVLTSMDLKDVAGATHEASTVTIHHYPVAEPGGCSSAPPSSRTRKYAPVTLTDASLAKDLAEAVSSLVKPKDPRKLLIMVNPFSGKKLGLKIYDGVVRPMLERTGTSFQTVLTEYAGHAEEFVKSFDFEGTGTTGVVTVSGDGLLFEVCQALRSRPDDVFGKITLGIVAAGSGNGLAASINHYIERPTASAVDNAFSICRGRVVPFDLSSYEVAGGKKYTSFLSLAWGIVADVDLESEVFRALGPLRFDVYAVWRMLALKKYSARFSYIDEEGGDMPALSEPVPASWTTIDDEFACFWAVQTSHAAYNMYTAPPSGLSDGKFRILVVRKGAGRLSLLRSFLAFETGDHMEQPWVECITCTKYRLEPTTNNSHLGIDGEEVEYGPIQAQMEGSKTTLYA